MTNKKKRVRYRQVLVRPFYQPIRTKSTVKVKAQPSQTQPNSSGVSSGTSTGKHSKVKHEAVSTGLASEAIAAPVNNGPLASFEPDNDPYAHFVSQLPSILLDLPNLVTKREQANEDNAQDLQEQPEPLISMAYISGQDLVAEECRYQGHTEVAKVNFAIEGALITNRQASNRQASNRQASKEIKIEAKAETKPQAEQVSKAQSKQPAKAAVSVNNSSVDETKDSTENTQIEACGENQAVKNKPAPNESSPASADKNDDVTAQSNEQSSEVVYGELCDIWFDWPDKGAQPDLSLCRLLGKGHRRAWSKVVSSSYLQPRFAGHVKRVKPSEKPVTPSGFLTGMLYQMAQKLDVPIANVLFHLSSVSAVKQFLLDADWQLLVDCLAEHYQGQDNSKKLNFQSLTVNDCIEALHSSNKIHFTHSYPPQLLAHMNEMQAQVVSWADLVVTLSLLINQGSKHVVTITVEDYHYAIEINGNEVILFGVDDEVKAMDLQKFIMNLQQYMAIPMVAYQPVQAKLYRHQGLSEQGLMGRYKAQVQNWQGILSQPLLEFIRF